MRRLAICIAMLIPLARQAQQPPADLPPFRQALWKEIRAVNDSMEAAFNRGDMKAVSLFYADDAKMAGGLGPATTGRAAFDAYWARAGANGGRWKLEVHSIGGNRDIAYQTGRSNLVTRDANGVERASVIDFVVVWKRDAKGGLRILMDLY
jgi:ketosteroid isomerase-like protein